MSAALYEIFPKKDPKFGELGIDFFLYTGGPEHRTIFRKIWKDLRFIQLDFKILIEVTNVIPRSRQISSALRPASCS